jgi:hypothetical protein
VLPIQNYDLTAVEAETHSLTTPRRSGRRKGVNATEMAGGTARSLFETPSLANPFVCGDHVCRP